MTEFESPDEPLSLSIHSAREAALRVLEEHRASGMWVSDLLDRAFRESRLPQIERGLATELVCGVVRRQGTLDAILKQLVARPAQQVEVSLWTILRLGVYQIVLLDGIPQHAAVHETVELCKRAGRMRWSGFVNGVLRGATRLITDQFVDEPSESAAPVSQNRHRKLTKPVFSIQSRTFLHISQAPSAFPFGWSNSGPSDLNLPKSCASAPGSIQRHHW